MVVEEVDRPLFTRSFQVLYHQSRQVLILQLGACSSQMAVIDRLLQVYRLSDVVDDLLLNLLCQFGKGKYLQVNVVYLYLAITH